LPEKEGQKKVCRKELRKGFPHFGGKKEGEIMNNRETKKKAD